MGETTGIAWTDSTINVWHGCAKVSDGCKHCYAEVSTPVRVKRAAGLEVWGPHAARDETKGWEANLRKWDRARREAIVRRRRDPYATAPGKPWLVFGQSLSDTFEGRADLDPLRARFFAAIERYDALTYQLLTKRIENVTRMVPPSWLTAWPAHVWIGCTVENQPMADERIPHLLRVPAPVRFLSVEPQIEAVDVRWALGPLCVVPATVDHVPPSCSNEAHYDAGILWVIQGGESGTKARPFDLAWARSMRDQCRAAGVPYFLKQLGARPVDGGPAGRVRFHADGGLCSIKDSHGAVEGEWPADLRGCRAFPGAADGR